MSSSTGVKDEDEEFTGPYRATKIWNNIIKTFKNGVPVGRRRRYMKFYDKAFTSSEATDWMHTYLKNNPNFGTDVTRQQTVQLLSKLLKARIFEEAQSSKKKHDFSDGNRIYRINRSSPAKDSRVPLSARMDLMNAAPGQKIMAKAEKKSKNKKETENIPKCRLVAKPLTMEAMEGVWKMVTLYRLQKTIGYNTLDDFLEASLVNGRHIMHNCLYVNKSGVVGNVSVKDQLPHWVLSAMKSLVHWPNKVDENFDVYPGFEKDVFRVVSEYFHKLSEPLLTHCLYETITNVFVMADTRHARHSSPLSTGSAMPSLTSFGSIDNLLLNMTTAANGQRSFSNRSKQSYSRVLFDDTEENNNVSSGLTRSQHSMNRLSSGSKQKCESTGSIPLLRYETAFGPENKTLTNVYYYPNQNTTTFSASMFSRLPSVSNLEYTSSFKENTNTDSPSRWKSEQHLQSVDNQTREIIDSYGTYKSIPNTKSSDKTKNNYSSSQHKLFSQHEFENINVSNNQIPGARLRKERSLPSCHKAWRPADSMNYGRQSTASIPNLSPVETLDKHGRKRYSTISGAWPMADDERVKQAMRLVLLLLPSNNRRKLHLLLRFLSKVKANTELQLAESPDALQNLLVDTFYQSIICSPDACDMDINLAKHLVLYLIDNHDIVMQIPSDLRSQVEERLSQLQRVQIVYASDDKGATSYCKQVPISVYEKQSLRHSTDALSDLLRNIAADEKMNQKEKTKKLQEFQRLYPQIYEKELGESGPVLPPPKPKPKRNVHLPRPLRRLRTLRA